MGGMTGFREDMGLGEAFEYGRRAPVRRSLVEDRGEALRPSLAVALGQGALRRSGVSSGLVEVLEDKPLPPGVIDEIPCNVYTSQPISKNRQSTVEGIVRILQEKGRAQSSVIGVGGEGKPGTQGGRPAPRPPQTGQPGTQGGDVLRRSDSKRSGKKGTQSGEVGKEKQDDDQDLIKRRLLNRILKLLLKKGFPPLFYPPGIDLPAGVPGERPEANRNGHKKRRSDRT